jgi:hypothetical protein
MVGEISSSGRLRVARVGEIRNVYRIQVGESEGMKPFRRCKV